MKNNSRRQQIINEAIRYLSLGFSPIPLGEIIKDSSGKKIIEYPKNGWKKFQENKATSDEVKEWNYKNIGIVTGAISDVVVLDVDSYKKGFDPEFINSLELPITPVQKTANGGKQYFFKYPKTISIKNAVCIGKSDSGVDIRGDGGMVIVAPTKTTYGEYTWIIDPKEEPLAELPPKLLALLKNESKSDTVLKPKKELNEIVGLKEGEGRNNAMASFIGKLLKITNPHNWVDEVWPMAQEVNKTYKPPLESVELAKIFNSISKRELQSRSQSKNSTNEEEKEAPFNPAISHGDLISKVFPPIRFTLEPFFEQGTVNMLSAPPNSWKSWFLLFIIAFIVKGKKIFEKFATHKSKVMVVNEEDSDRLIQDRMRLLHVTESELPIYYRIAQGSKLEDKFVDNLIEEANSKSVSVIIFDSLRAVHDADENNSADMQKVMDQFKKISRQGITVIFTHHHRKKAFGSKGDDAESARGSSAINAAISGHISLEEIEDEDGKALVVRHLKSKVGEKLKPFVIGIEVVKDKKVSFYYRGEHQAQKHALTEAKSRLPFELMNRTDLLGRKDFVYLKFGATTTLKEATNSLVEEGKLKVILRKDAQIAGYRMFSERGKPNEKLYYLDSLDKIDKKKGTKIDDI